MTYRTAKVFRNGGSQAVRVPHVYQLQCEDVWIWRQPGTDDLVLSPRLPDWSLFVTELRFIRLADSFLRHPAAQAPVHQTTGAN